MLTLIRRIKGYAVTDWDFVKQGLWIKFGEEPTNWQIIWRYIIWLPLTIWFVPFAFAWYCWVNYKLEKMEFERWLLKDEE